MLKIWIAQEEDNIGWRLKLLSFMQFSANPSHLDTHTCLKSVLTHPQCLFQTRENKLRIIQYGERIRRNPLWKQKIMSGEPNLSTESSRASSGTIYIRERTSAQTDNSLLVLWRRSERQEQSVSSSGTLRTGTKISSSWTKNLSPSRSSVTTRTTRFALKRPLRCILRVQGGHHPS